MMINATTSGLLTFASQPRTGTLSVAAEKVVSSPSTASPQSPGPQPSPPPPTGVTSPSSVTTQTGGFLKTFGIETAKFVGAAALTGLASGLLVTAAGAVGTGSPAGIALYAAGQLLAPTAGAVYGWVNYGAHLAPTKEVKTQLGSIALHSAGAALGALTMGGVFHGGVGTDFGFFALYGAVNGLIPGAILGAIMAGADCSTYDA